MSHTHPMAFRLLALDIDGTLLGLDGEPRTGALEALARARQRGIRAVLCTGRRYRRAADVARSIGLHVPLVCNSGALVKDPTDHRTLWRADIPNPVVDPLLTLLTAAGHPFLTFLDHEPTRPDFVIDRFPRNHMHFDTYVSRNADHAQIDPHWTATLRSGDRPCFHVCVLGERPEMAAVQAQIQDRFGTEFITFVQQASRFSGWMCEIIHRDAGKWNAVCHVADDWNIERHEICAIGDDANDRPMLEGARLGVAMAHAPLEIRQAARLVLDESPESLARFLDALPSAARGPEADAAHRESREGS